MRNAFLIGVVVTLSSFAALSAQQAQPTPMPGTPATPSPGQAQPTPLPGTPPTATPTPAQPTPLNPAPRMQPAPIQGTAPAPGAPAPLPTPGMPLTSPTMPTPAPVNQPNQIPGTSSSVMPSPGVAATAPMPTTILIDHGTSLQLLERIQKVLDSAVDGKSGQLTLDRSMVDEIRAEVSQVQITLKGEQPVKADKQP